MKIRAALEARKAFARINRRLAQREMMFDAVIGAVEAQLPHMQHSALERCQRQFTRRGDVEIGACYVGAGRHGVTGRQIDGQRDILERLERSGIGGKRAQIQSGDQGVGGDRPLIGRQGYVGYDMGGAAGNRHTGIEAHRDRLTLGGQREAGMGCDRAEARSLVEDGQVRIADRETLQTGRGGALGLDHVIETGQHVVSALVALATQSDAAFFHMDQR